VPLARGDDYDITWPDRVRLAVDADSTLTINDKVHLFSYSVKILLTSCTGRMSDLGKAVSVEA
jgi:hypothetical protein